MTMAAEWEKNRKEEDSVNVEVLFRNLRWEAEQNHGNRTFIGIRTGYLDSRNFTSVLTSCQWIILVSIIFRQDIPVVFQIYQSIKYI